MRWAGGDFGGGRAGSVSLASLHLFGSRERLAARAGVNIQTVRFYERRGILPKPERTTGGYRVHSAEAVRLIRFIERGQDIGFTLDEVEDLLCLRNSRRVSCAQARVAGQANITRRRREDRGTQNDEMRACCSSGELRRNDQDREYPIIETLEVPNERTP